MMTSKTHIAAKRMKHVGYTAVLMMILSSTGAAFAQKGSNVQQSLSWATGIVIDGRMDDWGDTLLYENSAQKLQYQIKNDSENVYVAMRVHDRDRQMQALSQGFGFMVNAKGRKRDGPALIYPIADRESYRAIMSADNEDRPDDMRQGALDAVRAIYVLRFDDVLDGQISLDNHYGIHAMAIIDTTDALCVEAVISLERLGLDASSRDEIAFNVRINGVIMPASRNANNNMRRGYPYGYGYGYPYGYGQNTPSRPREETGVWVMSPLATVP